MSRAMVGNRGQQLGEYAVMVGIAATAVLAMQLPMTRVIGGTLIAAGRQVLDPNGTSVPETGAGEFRNATTTTDVAENGSSWIATTSVASTATGNAGSGFILAEPLGPYRTTQVNLKYPSSSLAFNDISGGRCGADCVKAMAMSDPEEGASAMFLSLDYEGDGDVDAYVHAKLSTVLDKYGEGGYVDQIALVLVRAEEDLKTLAALKADKTAWSKLTPDGKKAVDRGLIAARRIMSLSRTYGQLANAGQLLKALKGKRSSAQLQRELARALPEEEELSELAEAMPSLRPFLRHLATMKRTKQLSSGDVEAVAETLTATSRTKDLRELAEALQPVLEALDYALGRRDILGGPSTGQVQLDLGKGSVTQVRDDNGDGLPELVLDTDTLDLGDDSIFRLPFEVKLTLDGTMTVPAAEIAMDDAFRGRDGTVNEEALSAFLKVFVPGQPNGYAEDDETLTQYIASERYLKLFEDGESTAEGRDLLRSALEQVADPKSKLRDALVSTGQLSGTPTEVDVASPRSLNSFSVDDVKRTDEAAEGLSERAKAEADETIREMFRDEHGQMNETAYEAFLHVLDTDGHHREGYYFEAVGGQTFKKYVASGEYRKVLKDDEETGATGRLVRRALEEASNSDSEFYQALVTKDYLGSVTSDLPGLTRIELRAEDNAGLIRLTYYFRGKPLLVRTLSDEHGVEKEGRDQWSLAEGVEGILKFDAHGAGLPIGIALEEDPEGFDIVFGTSSGAFDLEVARGPAAQWEELEVYDTYTTSLLDPGSQDVEKRDTLRPIPLNLDGDSLGDAEAWLVWSGGTPSIVTDTNQNGLLDVEDLVGEEARPIALVSKEEARRTARGIEVLLSYVARGVDEQNERSKDPIVANSATGHPVDVDDDGIPDLFESNATGEHHAFIFQLSEAAIDPKTVAQNADLSGFQGAMEQGYAEQAYLDPQGRPAWKGATETLHDDQVMVEDALATNKVAADFADGHLWLQDNPKSRSPNAVPLFAQSWTEFIKRLWTRPDLRDQGLGFSPSAEGVTQPLDYP